MFYDRPRKRRSFNTGDCSIEVTAWTGETVFLFIAIKFQEKKTMLIDEQDRGRLINLYLYDR